MKAKDYQQWRRLALQISAQLPQDPAEALVVLGLCRELIQKFFVVPGDPVEPVVKLVIDRENKTLAALKAKANPSGADRN